MPVIPGILTAIYRAGAGLDISWAQELCIFMFIWMAKFGAAYGVRTGIHVGVDVLVNLLPPKSRKEVILFAIGCGAFFTFVIAAFGATFVGEMFKTGQQSYDLEWPMWAIYSAIPLGSGLMCFRFLQVAWWYYWTGELPHHSEAKVEGVEATAALPLHPSTSPHGEVPSRWSNPLAWTLILAPIFILAVCFAHKTGVIVLPQSLRALTIFVLLIAFMVTGMPVSIALGLTVLTFLFILTNVPIEAVSMKLFTGLESFEIMAIPFFILAGNFLSHGGVARRMIDFAVSLIGHWHGGLGPCRHRRLRDVRAGLRLERRHRRRHRRHRAARDGAARLSDAVRRRHHHGRRLARHPDAAVDPEDRLRSLHQYLDRRAVRRRPAARLAAHRHAVRRDVASREAAKLSAHGESELGANPGARSAKAFGA